MRNWNQERQAYEPCINIEKRRAQLGDEGSARRIGTATLPSPLHSGPRMKTLSSRRRGINVDMTDSQLKANKDRRTSVLKGLRKHLRQTKERLNEGANVWGVAESVEFPQKA